jgi:hypothetical protein
MDIVEGVTSVILDSNDVSDVSIFTLNDLTAAQAGAVTIEGVTQNATDGNGTNVELDLADGTGTSDSASVTASVAAGNVITIGDSNGDIEGLTVALNGDVASSLTLDASDFSTGNAASLTVTGGATGRTMTITQTTSNVIADTVDLSGVAGNVAISLGAANQTVTGGTGNDTFTFTTNLSGLDTVNGGDGNDRIVIDPASTIATAATVSNIEELEIGATATVSVNVGNFAIPEVVLQAQAGITNVVTLAGADGITDLTITAATGGSNDDFNGLTFTGAGNAGTSDAITITGSTVNDSVTTGALTLAGIENITINVTGDSTEDSFTVGNLVNNAVNTMTVTSSGFGATTTAADIILGSVGDGANGMTSFDATGADTGVSVTLADMAANSTVTGGAFRDAIVMTGSAGGSFVNGGAGNDTLTASAAGDTINGDAGNDTLNGAGGADTITGGAGSDTIDGNAAADTISTGDGIDTIVRNGDALTDGADTVTDFTAGGGGDIIDLQTNGAQAAGVGAALTAIESAANGSIGATTGLLIYTGNDLASANEAGVEDIFDATTANFSFNAASDEVYLLASDGSNTYLFFLDAATGNTEFTAADDVGTLMMTFSGATDATAFTTANFADLI